MKKKSLLTIAVALVSVLASCGGGETVKDGPKATEAVQTAIKTGEGLSRAELMKKAVEELKANNGAHIKFLAVTSRGGKPAAKAEFVRQLHAAGYDFGGTAYPGDKAEDKKLAELAPVDYESTVDGKIYTTLGTEIAANKTDGYDGAILQDGYQLQTKFIDKGYFTNYIPKEWKDDASTLKDGNDNPFTLQYNFKTWMFNNKGITDKIDNVWDVTQAKYKGKIHTMDPTNENVNMDWMIMLTEPKAAKALHEAFDKDTNDNKSLDVSAYKDYGDDLKYSYAFIAKFIENAVFYADDGKAVNQLAKEPGSLGWIVYSKIQNVAETNEVSKRDIVIPALGDDNTDGNTITDSKLDGFAGFMYKHYMSMMPYTTKPYTTMAFMNVLSTTANGYKNWATDVGDYPTMSSINVDRTKNGHGTLDTELTDDFDKEGKKTGQSFKWHQDSTKDNVFPCLNDPKADWWTTKGNAVVETPSYIGGAYNRVHEFIKTEIARSK